MQIGRRDQCESREIILEAVCNSSGRDICSVHQGDSEGGCGGQLVQAVECVMKVKPSCQNLPADQM